MEHSAQLFEKSQAQDHWQLLGLSRGASTQEVKVAFAEKARRYHPDRYRSVTDKRFHEKLSQIFSRLQEAFETLSSETGATRYATLTAKETEYAAGTNQWEPPSEQAVAGDSSLLPNRTERAITIVVDQFVVSIGVDDEDIEVPIVVGIK